MISSYIRPVLHNKLNKISVITTGLQQNKECADDYNNDVYERMTSPVKNWFSPYNLLLFTFVYLCVHIE